MKLYRISMRIFARIDKYNIDNRYPSEADHAKSILSNDFIRFAILKPSFAVASAAARARGTENPDRAELGTVRCDPGAAVRRSHSDLGPGLVQSFSLGSGCGSTGSGLARGRGLRTPKHPAELHPPETAAGDGRYGSRGQPVRGRERATLEADRLVAVRAADAEHHHRRDRQRNFHSGAPG